MFYEFNRKRECLPDDNGIDQRILDKKGLTRPELSIILAFSKIILFQRLLEDKKTDFKQYKHLLFAYFPTTLCDRFANTIEHHSLSREIIVTTVTNQLLNQMGPIDVFELIELHKNDVWKIVDGYLFITSIFKEKLDQLSMQTSHCCAVEVLKQLLNVYCRHQNFIKKMISNEGDFFISTKNWFSDIPNEVLPEFFDLFCQIKVDGKDYSSCDVLDIYKRLDSNLYSKGIN
jgi:glutamate dehydrogenase